MKTSASVKYAFLATSYIAQHGSKGLVIADAISEHCGIPKAYLPRTTQALLRMNILHSKRGIKGGFSLGRPLNKITMLDLIEAIEGPMDVSLALEENAPKDKFAAKMTAAYDKVTRQTRAALAKIKLSDLM